MISQSKIKQLLYLYSALWAGVGIQWGAILVDRGFDMMHVWLVGFGINVASIVVIVNCEVNGTKMEMNANQLNEGDNID